MRNFKLLLRSLFVFVLIVFAVSTAIVYPYFHFETYHYQDGHVRDKMAGEIDFIVCGASQAQRGISAKIIDQKLSCNSYNLGTPLLTFQGKYTLLEKELERNPVKTVVLEFCYDSMVRDRDEVGAEGDYYMLGRYTNPFERLGYFFKCARLSEYANFYYDMLDRGIKSWKQLGDHPVGSSESYENKGYSPLPSKPIEMIDKKDYNKEEILTVVSEENEYYLDKIFKLCEQKGVKVIMVSTPLSDAAILSYDELDTIHSYYKSVSEKYNCEYYNFSLYKGKSELFPDKSAFEDRNHLAQKGAEDFTELMCDVIADSLDGKDSYDLFYDDFKTAQTDAIIPLYK